MAGITSQYKWVPADVKGADSDILQTVAAGGNTRGVFEYIKNTNWHATNSLSTSEHTCLVYVRIFTKHKARSYTPSSLLHNSLSTIQ